MKTIYAFAGITLLLLWCGAEASTVDNYNECGRECPLSKVRHPELVDVCVQACLKCLKVLTTKQTKWHSLLDKRPIASASQGTANRVGCTSAVLIYQRRKMARYRRKWAEN